MNEFLESEVLGLIATGICCLVLIYILRGQSRPIVIKLLRGIISGLITSAVLHYLLHLPLEWVAIGGILILLVTVATTKIKQ